MWDIERKKIHKYLEGYREKECSEIQLLYVKKSGKIRIKW